AVWGHHSGHQKSTEMGRSPWRDVEVPVAEATVRRYVPALCRGSCCAGAPLCEQTCCPTPGGPRSGPGFAVPVHHHLLGPIRPTRGHIPTSPTCGLLYR